MKKDKTPVQRIINAVQGEDWAINESGFANILAIAERENDLEAVLAKRGEPLDNTRNVITRDGVAVIPVRGPIMRYANIFGDISGGTSVQILATDIKAAVESPEISAIVLDFDSPGGMVNGSNELAGMVREASQEKPVVAYVGSLAASAAYWIASAAQSIVMEKTAMVGSIGIVVGAYREKDDGRIEIVSSQSPYKRYSIDSEDGKQRVQARVDALAEIFIDTVAQNRGVTPEIVKADFGQGDALIASDAVAAGMADEIGTLESVIAGFAGNGRNSTTKEVFQMSGNDKAPAIQTRADLKAVNPELLASIEADAKAAGVTDAYAEGLAAGIAQETARIQSVEDKLIAGHEDLIAELKFDGKTTGPEAAVKVLAAEKAAGSAALKKQADEAPAPAEPTSEADADPKVESFADLPDDERVKAEWDHSAEIRAEFNNDFDSYKAFSNADAAGQAKILGK